MVLLPRPEAQKYEIYSQALIGLVNVRSGQIRFAKTSAKEGVVPSLHGAPKIANDTDYPRRQRGL